MNQTFYERLLVDEPGITSDRLRPPFNDLRTAAEVKPAWNGETLTQYLARTARDEKRLPRGETPRNDVEPSLTGIYSAAGLSTDSMVELRGIEPLTFSMRTRRATNCATAPGTSARRTGREEL